MESSLGFIAANMLIKVYNLLYRPSDIAAIFTEFSDYIWKTYYTDGMFTSLWSVMKSLGIGLLIAGWLIDLMDKVSSGDFTIKNFFKHYLKFFILYVILLKSVSIMRWIINATTLLANQLIGIADSGMTTQKGSLIVTSRLAYGINYMGFGARIATIMQALIPFVIATVFYIICYFFATSRLVELVIRMVCLPMVVGISYFQGGENSDVVRFLKRTMGVLFQVIVVVVISASLTFVHNALVENETNSNPAEILEISDKSGTYREVTGGAVDSQYINQTMTEQYQYPTMYSDTSVSEFIEQILGGEDYFINMGLMIAALLMIFKSRQIATDLFK